MSIKIDLKIILFIFLFCITSQIQMYLILLFFAFIHEMGHLVIGIVLGFKAKEIKIRPIGVELKFKEKYEENAKPILKGSTIQIRKILIATSGPITNFIIIIISEIFFKEFKNIEYIIYSNFLIAIFNMLPIYPLDGGRILKEILHIFLGGKKGKIYTYKISKIIVIVLTIFVSIAILYVRNIALIIIIIYLWIIVIEERKKSVIKANNLK